MITLKAAEKGKTPGRSAGRLRIRFPMLFEAEGEGAWPVAAVFIVALVFLGICVLFGRALN